MRALVCSDLTLSLNREQAPGKSHKHHYPTLPVGKLRQPTLVVPLDISQQVFVMMLEEHLDREACWCCLCAVGNVLFWVLPKISQLVQLAIRPLVTDALPQLWPLSWLEVSERVPSFPIPLYNSSKAEHPKFAGFTSFILLPYSSSTCPKCQSQAHISRVRVIDSWLEL